MRWKGLQKENPTTPPEEPQGSSQGLLQKKRAAPLSPSQKKITEVKKQILSVFLNKLYVVQTPISEPQAARQKGSTQSATRVLKNIPFNSEEHYLLIAREISHNGSI